MSQLKVTVRKNKPTSPGRRHRVHVSANVYKGSSYARLTESLHQSAGRNNAGRLTVRRSSAVHRRKYRIIDWKRSKFDGVPAVVERIERDPNRTALIALLCYENGERSYIIHPKGLAIGDKIMSGAQAPISVGNTLPLDLMTNSTCLLALPVIFVIVLLWISDMPPSPEWIWMAVTVKSWPTGYETP